MKRTSRRLADGREILYFDAGRQPVERTAEDTRDLPPVSTRSQLRYDALLDEWVIVASHRQTRTFLPPADQCPLCPSRDGRVTEIPDSSYQVVVFENRFPSLATAVDRDVPPVAPGAATAELRPGFGRCEVVCFSPEHLGSFSGLTESRARTVIEAWAHRTAELSALPGVQQVFPFENRGEAIGVTLHHPHGQIYAYPYITPRTQTLIRSLEKVGPDLFARILDFEQAGERVLLAGEHWTAFVPFAARWPLEVHLLPHRHVPDFAGTTTEERDELSRLYLKLLRGIDALYPTPTPYIAAWHQAPVHAHRDDVRLMLQITSPRRAADKLKFLAGSEAAMGAWIGDVPPEKAAEFLREGLSRA